MKTDTKKRTKKPKSQFSIEDVLLHTKENKFFVVQAKDFMAPKKDWLYTLKLVSNDVFTIQYKRCYESEVADKYSVVKNPETIKLIYGKG